MKSSVKATAVIQDLLTLAGRGVPVSEIINLNQIVEDYFQTPEFERLKSYHPHVAYRSELDGELLNVRGTGPGLAVVWGTVKDHKGYIDIQSKTGKDSILTLYFPEIREAVKMHHHLATTDYDVGTGVTTYRNKGKSLQIRLPDCIIRSLLFPAAKKRWPILNTIPSISSFSMCRWIRELTV